MSTSQSFRDFARRLSAKDPRIIAFKPLAKANDFPNANGWGAIRQHLISIGADHEAVVGARLAWKQFRERQSV